MGICTYENACCNAVLSDDDDECSSCYSATHTASNNKTEMQQKLNIKFNEQQNTINILNAKDLVGNSKEFRIENNKCNLRIIGNSNRIRITNNFGNLQIIGNSTRLKIAKNYGYIKYTGNDGRICLGSESTQQTVDYIGCNGLLKVVNSMEFNKTPERKNVNYGHEGEKTRKIHSDKQTKTTTKITTNNLPGNANHDRSTLSTSASLTKNSSLSPKSKSASSDSINDFKNAKWQEFNDLLSNKNGWQHFAKVSLPNLKENLNEPTHCGLTCDCKFKKKKTTLLKNTNSKNNNTKHNGDSKTTQVNNHTNVHNFGDIIISNSVNIRIA